MYELNGIRMVRNDRTILSIDHLEIPTHELTLILGHNGSGKSTLASIISGLVKPDAGTTKLEGCDLFTLSERERAQRAAFLPQKLPASEGLTCRELVRLGRFPWRGLFGRWRAEDEAAVDEALAATGTAQYAQSYVDDLSGGERQRVWISMLLAQASPVMILDEPTSALDVRHQYGTLALLERLNRETGRGVIAIIHDINLALRFATHIVALKEGRVLFSGGAELLHSEENLRTLLRRRSNSCCIRIRRQPIPAARSSSRLMLPWCANEPSSSILHTLKPPRGAEALRGRFARHCVAAELCFE